jgi:uncharacterized membrane protein YgcG
VGIDTKDSTAGASKAIRDYMSGKISSNDYFRTVQGETSRRIRDGAGKPAPTPPKHDPKRD